MQKEKDKVLVDAQPALSKDGLLEPQARGPSKNESKGYGWCSSGTAMQSSVLNIMVSVLSNAEA